MSSSKQQGLGQRLTNRSRYSKTREAAVNGDRNACERLQALRLRTKLAMREYRASEKRKREAGDQEALARYEKKKAADQRYDTLKRAKRAEEALHHKNTVGSRDANEGLDDEDGIEDDGVLPCGNPPLNDG